MLEARSISVRYAGADRQALTDVSAAVTPGRWVAVVGPNGCGKTTLLRALLGSVPVESGQVELDGRPVVEWSARARARRVGVVWQREDYPFAWRVDEFVMFGRYAWLGPLAAPRARDRAMVDDAMARCDVRQLSARRVGTLSGGEWQRVRVARALAQEPRLLVLDEPSASLDLGHEMELFELVRRLVDDGLGAIVVTHHLNIAARFADEMLLLAAGRAVAQGTPDQVLEVDRLSAVFEWPVEVLRSPDDSPVIVPKKAKNGGHTGQ